MPKKTEPTLPITKLIRPRFFARVQAMAMRYLFLLRHEIFRYIDLFYWPLFDLFVWGNVGAWIQASRASEATSQAAFVLLAGLTGWILLNRAHMEVGLNFAEEMWSDNVAGIFSTPVTAPVWIITVMFLGIFKCSLVLAVTTFCSWLIFGIAPLLLLKAIGLTFPLLILNGWLLGFLSTALMTQFGRQAQQLIWVLGWLASPLSGVFYPVEMLPLWAQKLSTYLPMTQTFNILKTYIKTETVNWSFWLNALIFSSICALASIILFKLVFDYKKNVGLGTLDV